MNSYDQCFSQDVMTGPADHRKLQRVARRMLAIGQWIAQGEKLPQSDPEPLPRRSALNDIGWLTGRDRLPTISQPLQAQDRVLSWLIAPERLPIGGPGYEPGARSLFRWLFTADQLTVPRISEPTKETSSDEP